jgi:hypothetical protein
MLLDVQAEGVQSLVERVPANDPLEHALLVRELRCEDLLGLRSRAVT